MASAPPSSPLNPAEQAAIESAVKTTTLNSNSATEDVQKAATLSLPNGRTPRSPSPATVARAYWKEQELKAQTSGLSLQPLSTRKTSPSPGTYRRIGLAPNSPTKSAQAVPPTKSPTIVLSARSPKSPAQVKSVILVKKVEPKPKITIANKEEIPADVYPTPMQLVINSVDQPKEVKEELPLPPEESQAITEDLSSEMETTPDKPEDMPVEQVTKTNERDGELGEALQPLSLDEPLPAYPDFVDEIVITAVVDPDKIQANEVTEVMEIKSEVMGVMIQANDVVEISVTEIGNEEVEQVNAVERGPGELTELILEETMVGDNDATALVTDE